MQPQGELIPPNRPLYAALHGKNPQVQNNAGGYVFKLDDIQRLTRFLIMGSEGGCYYVKDTELTRENVTCLDRIIARGDGTQAVQLIKEISTNQRNVKQNALLLAYAVCARCNDKDTKKAAYALLSEICRIPTHLFMFIKFCEQESKVENSEFGTGWGRAHKRAISRWYTQFLAYPEKLARLVTKYKNREGWTHKDVLRLAHTSTDDRCVGFILRYITKGLDKAREMYLQNAAEIDDETRVKLNKLVGLMEVFERAVKITDEDQMCYEIREHKLTWEQCNSELLKSPKVWVELLPHMGAEAVIRNLGRMTSIGMFAENSADEAQVLSKIQSMNSEVEVMEVDNEEPAEGQGETRGRRKDMIHPFKILLAICTYKTGHGDKGGLRWTPNARILAALDTAFYKAFETVIPTGKKFYLGVDVSGSMSQPVLGSKNIHCSTAAAAMMLMTAKTEQNYIIKGFSDKLVEIGVTPNDTLDVVQSKMDRIPMGGTDCAKPMSDAQEQKIKDIDVFIVYTDNETWFGSCHPVEALRQYRIYAENPQVKLIVCGMCSTEFSIADQEDPNMLDVVGFDSAAPRLISEFVMGNL